MPTIAFGPCSQYIIFFQLCTTKTYQTPGLSRILESYTFTNNLFIYRYFFYREGKFPSHCALTNSVKMNTELMRWVQPQLNALILEVLSLTLYNSHPNIFEICFSMSNSHSNISGLKHSKGDTLLFLSTIT